MSSKNSAPNGTTAPTSSPLKSPNSPLGPSPSVAMQVNVVKPLEDSDYEYAKFVGGKIDFTIRISH
jgi:hypothetical protein